MSIFCWGTPILATFTGRLGGSNTGVQSVRLGVPACPLPAPVLAGVCGDCAPVKAFSAVTSFPSFHILTMFCSLSALLPAKVAATEAGSLRPKHALILIIPDSCHHGASDLPSPSSRSPGRGSRHQRLGVGGLQVQLRLSCPSTPHATGENHHRHATDRIAPAMCCCQSAALSPSCGEKYPT